MGDRRVWAYRSLLVRTRLLTLGLALIMLLGGCGPDGKAANANIGSSEAPTGPGIFSAELNALCRQAQAEQMLIKPIRPAEAGRALVALDARYLRRILTFRSPASQALRFAQFRRNAAGALRRLEGGNDAGAVEIYFKNRPLAVKLGAPACRRWGLEPVPVGG